jgi:hypothetical protein
MKKNSINPREIMNKKIGLGMEYTCTNQTNDGVCNSVDMTYDDVSFLEDYDINPLQFNKIYGIYKDEIMKVLERNNDLKIYTLLDKNGDLYPVLKFDAERTKTAFETFYNNVNVKEDEKAPLREDSKIVLIEMLNLLKTYSKDELLSIEKEIKLEIDCGVYDFVKASKKDITQEEKAKLLDISDTWKKDEIQNYKNLPLLKKRYTDILSDSSGDNREKILSNIARIDLLIKDGIPSKDEIDNNLKITKSMNVANDMSRLYEDFEYDNRVDILKGVYSPMSNAVIDDEEHLQNILVHFFDYSTVDHMKKMLTQPYKENIIDGIHDRLKADGIGMDKKKIEEEYASEIDEKMTYLDDMSDELNPGLSVPISYSDVSRGRFDCVAASQGQLASFYANKEDILNLDRRFKSPDGVACAVGFDSTSVNPENIALTTDKNAFSNFGIPNIPCNNKFLQLSKTKKELLDHDSERTEVLLKRDTGTSMIKGSYLLCICDRELQDTEVKEKLNEYTKIAAKKGLKCVVIDTDTINRKREEKKKEIDDLKTNNKFVQGLMNLTNSEVKLDDRQKEEKVLSVENNDLDK